MLYRTTPTQTTVLALALFALFFTGCMSKYAIKQDDAREAVIRGDFSSAAKFYLEDKKPTDYVDVLLNRGLARFETGDFLNAENDLRRSYEKIDELFTKSISKGALSLVTNDRALAYSGTNLERGMLHYYRALGYLNRGDRDGFSIETRSLTKYLDQLPGLSKRSYTDDGFLRYFGGIGFDMASQPNDAWIAYEHARTAYPKSYGSVPTFVFPASLSAAKRTGIVSADSVTRSGVELPKSGEGRLVLIVETGVICGLENNEITIPLFEKDFSCDFDNNFDYDAYGNELWYRRDNYSSGGYKIVDWIRIAIPSVTKSGESQISQVRVGIDGNEILAVPAADLSHVFQSEFKDRFPGILARTFARAILKRGAANLAKKEGGDVGFWLTKIAGDLTEVADTRSWALLPDRIHVLDRTLPAGSHTINVLGTGTNIESKSGGPETIQIEPGKITVKRIRLIG
ncbi:MAG: hypothetical protein OEM52_09410 [bacterium]|nr:hypothetical protein [bacterium]